jgi:hypothetical protein
MAGYLRPVFRQHTLTERIDLDLSDRGHTGAFQAQF